MRSPHLFAGYWRNPAATAAAFDGAWLKMGDLGRRDAECYLYIVDRAKDVIISGGENIYPAEIEAVLATHPAIAEAAVIGAPDARFGETPMAIFYSSRPIRIEDLVAHCNARLADFKVPRYMVQSPQPLPRLATGKLSKIELRKQYAHAHETLARVR